MKLFSSIADINFKIMVKDILNRGISSEGSDVRARWSDGSPAHTRKIFGVVNRYNLSDQFPILNLRPVPFEKCVDELLWIWQKKSNNVKDLNSKIWDQWTDDDGTIGKAYGYQLAKKYIFPQGEMDQVDWVLWKLKNNPNDRAMIINMFNHEDLKDMNLRPCAYSITLNVVGNKLNMILNQRSQDVIVANGWNVAQYSVLQHMFAIHGGLEVGEFVHVIADAHIYDRHEKIAKELLVRGIGENVQLYINPEIKNFYDFKVEDFKLMYYKPNKQIKNIPVAK